MRAGFAGFLLATSLVTVSLAGTAAETIMVVDFETATGLDQLLGVENPGTPSAKNVGFEGFYWAWTGQGVVDPIGPPAAGFLLGNKNANSDFAYVGGSPPQFAYLTLSARVPEAYVTTKTESFDFLGGIFSSTAAGTLKLVGQRKNQGNGNGGGTYINVDNAVGNVIFEFNTEPQPTVPPVTFVSADFRNIDRLVISSVDTTGRAVSLQWALNDFTYAPVPEASTWAMFGLGILGVGFAVKRRKPRIR
jgi:hypothetical protein